MRSAAVRRPSRAFRAAAEAELAAAVPLRDNAYKIPLAINVITRTLRELSEGR